MATAPKGGMPRMSRRQFLKGAGVGAAGAAVAASVPAGSAVRRVAAAQATPVVRVGPRPGAPGTSLMLLTVNGTLYETAVDPRWTLAELLRDQLGLTGTKVGCDRGECGSCTVQVDGKAVLACMALAIEMADRQITTVEGLAGNGQLSALQQAFWEAGAVQCGFCTSGMLMSARALLDANPRPTEAEVRMALSGNLCRCTGYKKIVEAVLVASGQPPRA